jgi:hypothetical protein
MVSEECMRDIQTAIVQTVAVFLLSISLTNTAAGGIPLKIQLLVFNSTTSWGEASRWPAGLTRM